MNPQNTNPQPATQPQPTQPQPAQPLVSSHVLYRSNPIFNLVRPEGDLSLSSTGLSYKGKASADKDVSLPISDITGVVFSYITMIFKDKNGQSYQFTFADQAVTDAGIQGVTQAQGSSIALDIQQQKLEAESDKAKWLSAVQQLNIPVTRNSTAKSRMIQGYAIGVIVVVILVIYTLIF